MSKGNYMVDQYRADLLASAKEIGENTYSIDKLRIRRLKLPEGVTLIQYINKHLKSKYKDVKDIHYD